MLQEKDIKAALSGIIDPDLGKDIVSLGFVRDIAIEDGRVSLTIELTTPACPVKEEFRRQAEQALLALPGVREAEIRMSARVQGAAPVRERLPGVGHIIAVASGKGGVGKSTVAANLATALALSGARTGLLDADIHGPSVPRMMGLEGRRPKAHGKRIAPLENHGVRTMSIGYLLEERQATIWRGPMASGALMQLLRDVEWDELDYLVLDLPPGTGDIHLTLAQQVPMSGALIVTTPQDIALMDARRAIAMFGKTNVPVLGMVENMSGFICPHCGEASAVFGEGGAARLAEEAGAELLASIPLDLQIRLDADNGAPIVIAHPDSPQAAAFRQLAGRVAQEISKREQRKIDIPVIRA